MPAPLYRVDERLKEWATPHQAKCIDAINAHRSMGAAARALGISRSTVYDALAQAKKKAAIFGWSPDHDMTRTVPEPFKVKGVSTYYNKEGKASGQWVKSALDDEKREQMVRECLKALTEEVKGLAPITKAPSFTNCDLMAVYPFGDPHFGLYAWAKETGGDFDLDIAERLTLGAVDRLVETSPKADVGVVLPLGDIFHMDDQTNQTPAHKHQLDADGRFVKVLQVGIKVYKRAILRALEKHARVIVRFVQGNHDPHAVWALSLAIAEFFESDKRVTVDLSPSKFWFYEFGKCLIAATHGDTVKHDRLGGVMAADAPQSWGRTKHRYWYTGHIHNQTVTELPGVVCESFRTLAARDAWLAGHGYRAGRDMRSIILHREHGEVERHRVDVGMLV